MVRLFNYLLWQKHLWSALVQLGGLEPPTSCSTDRRSNQLSYNCSRCRPKKGLRTRRKLGATPAFGKAERTSTSASIIGVVSAWCAIAHGARGPILRVGAMQGSGCGGFLFNHGSRWLWVACVRRDDTHYSSLNRVPSKAKSPGSSPGLFGCENACRS